MSDPARAPLLRTGTLRDRPAFAARTATDDAAQLDRRPSVKNRQNRRNYGTSDDPSPAPVQEPNAFQPLDNSTAPTPREHSFTKRMMGHVGLSWPSQWTYRQGQPEEQQTREDNLDESGAKNRQEDSRGPKTGSLPRPIGGSEKLGTFSGVFVPTTLNVLSILMFLRFGLILGQAGFLGMMGMLVASYLINFVTTLSISAIATNGTVRGGGAYYLISRSLGPEFGGAIGVVLYLGFVFNTGMNAVGLIDCFKQDFGSSSGDWYNWLPEGTDYSYLWATVVLLICTGICLAGSGLFARASNGLLVLLLLATFSIPFSALVRSPFSNEKRGIEYTGISGETFLENFFPAFTKGAAGADTHKKESFQSLFGILFPATGGIFAGASMSGDLKHPSKAIPKGTLSGLGLTFVAYALVILAMTCTISRQTLYDNVNVIQDTNLSAVLILLGEFATSFFSSLMGVIGSAKLLQALARDNLLPGFGIFAQGTANGDEPTNAIIFTHVIAQITMLFDINKIASFVTMTYLMTFLVTNLACFLLKIGSAPNFRPSFVFFNAWTAGAGAVVSGVTMFFVDGQYASGCVGILIVLFLLIHYTSPPKSWGDVSQSLIYHQVRKYLLRLRQEHVKFWRPQILLFINNPRHQYKLMKFCNSMKKGALYILGHVIVANDFGSAVPEARRQQAAWTKYIDFAKCKAFVNIAISPAVEWGTRNIVLSAGLGGMRPNIAVLGFYNLSNYRKDSAVLDEDTPPLEDSGRSPEGRIQSDTVKKLFRRDSADAKLAGQLPTDVCQTEGAVGVKSYLTILEDLLLRIQINVALARGFQNLEFPDPEGVNDKKYIDLWPIQMSAEVPSAEDDQPNVLTTNFDTYTLILQLGCILNTVPAWKKAFKLRVAVFVEYETDVEEERRRVKTLLNNLRMKAEVLVFWLASGRIFTYESIVNGRRLANSKLTMDEIDKALGEEEWWDEIQTLRGHKKPTDGAGTFADAESTTSIPSTQDEEGAQQNQFNRLHRLLKRSKRRHTMQGLTKLGVNLGMRTHNLEPHITENHAAHASASEDSDNSSSSDSDSSSDAKSESKSPRVPSSSTRRHSILKRSSQSDVAVNIMVSNEIPAKDTNPDSTTPQTPTRPPIRPSAIRQSSHAKFTSKPVPRTKVASSDDLGPSIMFTPSTPPDKAVTTEEAPTTPSVRFSPSSSYTTIPRSKSDPNKPSESPSQGQSSSARSQPASAMMPLSFNDLPCRAQHLILNELIRGQSHETAVLFTTLPAPLEGTCNSEEDSVRYLTDLETLCEGLPPTMLVHSNSMTVTMNL